MADVLQNILNYKKLHNLTDVALAKVLQVDRSLPGKWESGESYPSRKKFAAFAQALGVTKEELLNVDLFLNLTSEGKSIRKTGSTGSKLIPFYDTIAVAGYEMEVNQEPVIAAEEMVDPGSWFKGATAAMRVTGDSMYPKYRAGAVVALREIFDKEHEIIWGEEYVIEMQENRVLKIVHQSEKGEEFIAMVSLNGGSDTRGRPKYPIKDYPIDKIRRLFKVIGHFDYETGAGGVFLVKGTNGNTAK